MFREHYNIPLVYVDAAPLFLGKLAGVTDPEAKRKAIDCLFIDVFERLLSFPSHLWHRCCPIDSRGRP